LDAIFSELTAYIILLFAALLSWLFALSEGQDTNHRHRAKIDTDQTAASLVEYRPCALMLIALAF
jgi:hypothetical protein